MLVIGNPVTHLYYRYDVQGILILCVYLCSVQNGDLPSFLSGLIRRRKCNKIDCYIIMLLEMLKLLRIKIWTKRRHHLNNKSYGISDKKKKKRI